MNRNELVAVLWIVTLAVLFELGVAIWSPGPGGRTDATLLRRPFQHQLGNAYLATVLFPGAIPDDERSRNRSTLQLYEDGKRLGPQHISSDDIAREGKGLYLFWRADSGKAIVFSTSDNSDPNTNGRTYRVFDPQVRAP